ncbi:hypothetical protein Rwratislav_19174 [Rhodococcus wratislaviensis IFP 2016]|nr:hypothetical protein Rwratislav_19174 [Rhodococcus wratislaviensis IFP 2016]
MAITLGSGSWHGPSGPLGGGVVVVDGGGFSGSTSAPDAPVGSGVKGEDAESSNFAHPAARTAVTHSADIAILRDAVRRRPPTIMMETLRKSARSPPRRFRLRAMSGRST